MCLAFFLKHAATTDIYTDRHTLSLHYALPILILVERRTINAVALAHLLLCLFGQRCACSICFRRDAELLHQCQRLIIYRGVVPDHLFCERPHGLVLGFRQSLFTSRDVDLPSGVCDVCNLGIVWMRPIMSHRHSAQGEKRGGAAKGEVPDHFCVSLVLDRKSVWLG